MSIFYSMFYRFYTNVLKEDKDTSWFYTVSALGFLYALNIGSGIHLYLAKNQIWLNKITYIVLVATPWVVHVIYFYIINKTKRKEIINDKSKSKIIVKLALFTYIILSNIVFFYTLILWADS